MPGEFRNIVAKELKEIVRDPRLLLGMILVPVVMLPLMGSAVRIGVEATQKSVANLRIGYANLDALDATHAYGDRLYGTLRTTGASVVNVTATDAASALDWAKVNSIDTLVVVPGNFTEVIAANRTADVLVFQVLRHFGMDESAGTGIVQSALKTFNDAVLQQRLGSATPTPAEMRAESVVRGEVLAMPPDVVVSGIMTSSLLIPVMIALVMIFACQLAATSVAMEKEQKTLEVLLTLPIRRMSILLGKLSGVILISLLATVAILFSMTYYMGSFMFGGARPVDLSSTAMAPELVGYVLLGVSLFLSLLAALALSVLLAAYTKDVRSAQSLMGILYLPIFIPAFVLMFAPLEIMPGGFQAVIYAIPFSYPILAAKALYTKEYLVVALGILYQVAFSFGAVWLAARLFASEKIMTARLRFGKKKAPGGEEP